MALNSNPRYLHPYIYVYTYTIIHSPRQINRFALTYMFTHTHTYLQGGFLLHVGCQVGKRKILLDIGKR